MTEKVRAARLAQRGAPPAARAPAWQRRGSSLPSGPRERQAHPAR